MMISAYAIQAKQAFIYIRAEFFEGAKILNRAIAKRPKLKVFVVKIFWEADIHAIWLFIEVPGAYICGEETGLIESLEGKRPKSRIKTSLFSCCFRLYQCPNDSQ